MTREYQYNFSENFPELYENEGRKIKNKQNKPVNKVFISLLKKIPRYEENVNNGPGIA